MKSQGQEGDDCTCTALCEVRVFICNLYAAESASLSGESKAPMRKGCMELIADPSSVAHLRQNEKMKSNKKEKSTSEEAAAVRISKVQCCNRAGWKRAYLSLKHASNPRPTMSIYKRWGWKQREQRGSGGRMGGRREERRDGGNRPVSFTFLFLAFHAWAVCILSATNTLFGLWSEGQSRSADPNCHIRATHATCF